MGSGPRIVFDRHWDSRYQSKERVGDRTAGRCDWRWSDVRKLQPLVWDVNVYGSKYKEETEDWGGEKK